jgi:hypothetical protein
VELTHGDSAGPLLTAELGRLGVSAALGRTDLVVEHVITHRSIQVEVWRGRGTGRLVRGAAAWHGDGDTRPLSALAKKLLATPAASGT